MILYLLATIGAIAALRFIVTFITPRENNYYHKRNVVLLNKDVSITDSRATLDIKWLARHGYHSLIYLRHDGFMDFFDREKKKAAENEWIANFADDAKSNGLRFAYTDYHDRKRYLENSSQLRRALDQSIPPVLIYGDETRNAGNIWALAEASKPDGMALDDILSSAEDFRPVNRNKIARVFKHARETPLPLSGETDGRNSSDIQKD
jgi:protein tyrosine phosphatase (PTP) superfamily phosphohydrolase (DUF442 family)